VLACACELCVSAFCHQHAVTAQAPVQSSWAAAALFISAEAHHLHFPFSTICKVYFESSVLARLFLSVPNSVVRQCQTKFSCIVLLAAEEREQDIPGKLEQEADIEEATDAMPGKRATGTPDLAGDAVSNTSEESSAPVKRGVEGPADTVTNSGMQGRVAESAASSNARQQSTSSVASPRPASASKPTSTIGACTCMGHFLCV